MIQDRTALFFRCGHSDVGETPDEILAHKDRLGGKSASLHAMAALGFKVPAGFTIPTDWCDIQREAGKSLHVELQAVLDRSLMKLEKITGRRISSASSSGDPDGPSLRVAVRSGAAESLPGMMDTVLDVDSREGIGQAVGQVFESYFSDRAVAYRREKGIVGLRGTAVTVQEMCPADFAGVAFTVDPERDDETMLIEAVAGLGESLVSGDVTPDRYRISRDELSVQSIETSERIPFLDRNSVRSVASRALELERAFGEALDIEWAIANGEVWLLQSRSIRRAASADPKLRALLTEEPRRMLRDADAESTLFARHNLDETLSSPTPMSWDLHRRFFRGSEGILGLYRDLGFQPSDRVEKDGFLALIGGRVYAEAGRAAEVFYGSDLIAWDPAALRLDPSLIDEPPAAWNRDSISFSKILRALTVMRRSARSQRKLRALMPQRFERTALVEWNVWIDEEKSRDLEPLSPRELFQILEEQVARCFGRFPREALLLSYLAGLAYSELEDFLERRLGSEPGREAARSLAGSIDSDSSVQQNLDLSLLAQGELTLEIFVERWGHRAAGEMELAQPRWREEPKAVERLARSLGKSGGEIEARIETRRLAVAREEQRITELVTRDCSPDAALEFKRRLELTRSLIPWRENWKHHWMRGLELLRKSLILIDERTGLEGQVFWLKLAELRRVVESNKNIDADLRRCIRDRRDAARMSSVLSLPAFLDQASIEEIERADSWPPKAAKTAERSASNEDAELAATPIASGRGEGRAWVCDSPQSECPFPPPFILVCQSTDPGWTPILVRAAGLIVERGGTLSHGAIVCRDFGVPAVAVPNATELIKCGASLIVNGDRGLVEHLKDDDTSRSKTHGKPAIESDGDSEGGPDGESRETSIEIYGHPRIPAEPWVPPVRSRLVARVVSGLALAILGSLAVVLVPAVGDALRPLARFACDWTLDAGMTPFASIAWSATLAAALATLIGIIVIDRGQLRAMRRRISWYRKLLKTFPDRKSIGKSRARDAASIVRRRRKASTERSLELLRPIGWSFLPFVLMYLWVGERFPAEPLQPGTAFEIHAMFRTAEGSTLRYARLDIDEPSRVRLIDKAWKKLIPNFGDPSRGPHTVVWAAEARSEGVARLTVTAGREKLGDEVLITGERVFAGQGAITGEGQISGLFVEYPPIAVELPRPLFRAVSAICHWIAGGRELDPRDLAAGSLSTFLALAVILSLLFQRLLGVR